MRAFRLTENKSICLVLADVGVRKTFFCHNCGMPQISHYNKYLTKRQKSAILFHFCFFFSLKEASREAASQVCITVVILLTRTLDEMIKALKIRLNGQKLGSKAKLIKLLQVRYDFYYFNIIFLLYLIFTDEALPHLPAQTARPCLQCAFINLTEKIVLWSTVECNY